MNISQKTTTTIALTLIAAAIITGGSYYWGTTTIIADSTPPHIIEAAATSGDLVYGTGHPKVTLVFTENVGVQTATATLYEIRPLNILGTKIEEITLTETTKNNNQYQYNGRFTKTLEANKEYFIVYQVTDTAGHHDTYGKDSLGRGTVRIKLVQVEATITVNGVQVKHTSDKIYVDNLNLFIEATITTGTNNIETIYATINTQRVDFTQSGTKYIATYKLPGDGSYTLYIKMIDTSGSQTMLASFSIELDTPQRTPIIILTLATIAATAIYLNTTEGKTR